MMINHTNHPSPEMTSIQASLFDPPPGITFGTPAADLVRHNAATAAAIAVEYAKLQR